MINRRKTRQIQLGNVKVGGGAPLTVQSMTKTDTRDVQATLLEIWSLEAAGCDIVRCAVPVREAAEKLGEIKRQIRIPLVADIHFNYKLALIALEQGVDGLRLNPGNIGGKKFVMAVVNLAKDRKIPIRIGVNAGSLEKDLLEKYGGPTSKGMVESALRHIHILEECNYPEMKISLKASDPLMMIEAYRALAEQVDYPLHLGVTEAGTPGVGTIKSAVGLGALLSEGIGDTIRVSLSADPTEEVRVGIDILKSLGLRKGGLTFVSCPSCGRADVDLVKLAKQVEDEFRGLNEEIHIAVMGCVPEGERIVTAAGLRPIEHVDEGDEVLTHTGEYRKVMWATRHAFGGELVEIQPAGLLPFRVTANHPVLASPFRGRASEWVRAEHVAADWILEYPAPSPTSEHATIVSTPVRGVRRVAYKGHVHNLEVDGIHSYVVPGAALHNCEVNGPGEARAADIGVAGGRGIGLIFKNGEVIRKVPEKDIVTAMREEVDKYLAERKAAKEAAGASA